MSNSCDMLNITALASGPVEPLPFPYMIIPQFIHPEYLEKIQADYPSITQAGSFPLNTQKAGATFNRLIEQLSGETLRQLIAEKFSLDLGDKPVLITVRGRADRHDGRIHTDSKSKLITILLYMNEDWLPDEGRLRLLHDAKNLDNYAAEVPPTAGTAVIFKVTENGWHGHKPIVGVRKVIQINYLSNNAALSKHYLRHRFSAKLKQWARHLPFASY